MTCGQVACRCEWRKRKNQDAYRKGRAYHRGHALRDKLMAVETQSQEAKRAPRAKNKKSPFSSLQLPREEMRDAMGNDAAVVMEYLLLLLVRRSRDRWWL
jgi:hypothetical protein